MFFLPLFWYLEYEIIGCVQKDKLGLGYHIPELKALHGSRGLYLMV